jgi:hypothetical protein
MSSLQYMSMCYSRKIGSTSFGRTPIGRQTFADTMLGYMAISFGRQTFGRPKIWLTQLRVWSTDGQARLFYFVDQMSVGQMVFDQTRRNRKIFMTSATEEKQEEVEKFLDDKEDLVPML